MIQLPDHDSNSGPGKGDLPSVDATVEMMQLSDFVDAMCISIMRVLADVDKLMSDIERLRSHSHVTEIVDSTFHERTGVALEVLAETKEKVLKVMELTILFGPGRESGQESK